MSPRRLSCIALTVALLLPLAVATPASADDARRAAVLEQREAARAATRAKIEKRRAEIAAKRAERAARRQLLQDTRAFNRLQVSGEQVAASTQRLVEDLMWHRDLETAKLRARAERKPILWIQALGEIDGFL